jgi:WD40 repeat protein
LGQAQLWKAHDGTPIATLSHGKGPHRAIFSPDGSRILTHAQDQAPKLWDGHNGQLIAELPQSADVSGAEFSSDGLRVLVRIFNAGPTLWDARSGTLVAKLATGDQNASFSAQGHVVVSSSGQTVRLWNAADGGWIATLPHDGEVRRTSFTADDLQLVTTSGSAAYVWSAKRGSSVANIGFNRFPGKTVISPDKQRFATTYYQHNTTELFDAQGSLVARLSHTGHVRELAFYLSGRRLLSGSEDGVVQLWDAERGSLVRGLGDTQSILRTALSADGTRILTQSGDMAQLWTGEDGSLVATLPDSAQQACALFGLSNRRFVTCEADGSARLWDAKSGALIKLLPHTNPLLGAALSDDELRLVTISQIGEVLLWDAQNGAFIARLRDGPGLYYATFDPSGKRILMYSVNDSGADLWDSERGLYIAELTKERVTNYSFSPDGKRLLLYGGWTAPLFDVASATVVATLRHRRGFLKAEFSKNGRRILTTHNNGSVTLWEGLKGELVATLIETGVDDRSIDTAGFSADGRIGVTTNGYLAIVWDGLEGHPLLTRKTCRLRQR